MQRRRRTSSLTAYAKHLRPPSPPAQPGKPGSFALIAHKIGQEETAYLLKQPRAKECACTDFQARRDRLFVRSRSGRFLLCRPHTESLLTKTCDVIARAVRRCPFDGQLIDPQLIFPSWSPAIETPPLCCLWMAGMTEDRHVHFPPPGDPPSLPEFIWNPAAPVAFAECPRCETDMRALAQRRHEFFAAASIKV